MMDKKEELKNNIMLKMRYHLDSQELDLLGVVLTDELTKVEVDAPETELATVDNTNEYIMDLFMLKKVFIIIYITRNFQKLNSFLEEN